ncbi:hypothetical protein PWT90_07699 [Aphanocladium album]|nr:hypothetical protein PWT90_07699 [Aphanocladium album]
MPNQPMSHSTESSQATKKTERRESTASTNSDGIRRSIDSATYDGVQNTALAVPTTLLPSLMSSAIAVGSSRRELNPSPERRGNNAQEVRMTKVEAKIVDMIVKEDGKKISKANTKDDAGDKNNAAGTEN